MMGWLARALAGRRRPSGDAGITLIELLVAMGVMGVFMTMFTGAVLQIYDVTNRSEAIGDAQTQVSGAVNRLDKEIRYATEISTPATVGGYWYAEYLTTHTGVSQCSQLRLDPARRELKLRHWTVGDAVPAWAGTPVLVAHLTAVTVLTPAGPLSTYEQLRLSLEVSSGGGATGSTRKADVTFTALNSDSSVDNNSVPTCTAER